MALSLRQAAQESGRSKSTVLRAIQAGRLSATRTDDGGWSIDPAELFRVYPRTGAQTDAAGQGAPPSAPPVADVIDAQVSALREIIARLDSQVEDLKGDRDRWREQAEASSRLLTVEREAGRRSWWKKLVG